MRHSAARFTASTMLRSDEGHGRQSAAPSRFAVVATSRFGVADITTTPGRIGGLRSQRPHHPHPAVVGDVDADYGDIGLLPARFCQRVARASPGTREPGRFEPAGHLVARPAIVIRD